MLQPWQETSPNLIPGQRHVFFLVPFGTKGYKLYDLAFRTCFVSKDVIFKESCFPFKHWIAKSTCIPSFPTSHSMFPN